MRIRGPRRKHPLRLGRFHGEPLSLSRDTNAPRLRTAVLLLTALLAVSACSAVDRLTGEPADIVGRWVVVHPANDGARTEQRLTFEADGSYRGELLSIGFYQRPADEVTGYLRTRGRYRMEGDC